MNIILELIKTAGKKYDELFHISIDNEPYMRLVIEGIGKGPCGLPAISVAHYGELQGDLMRDPEMCFELAAEDTLVPYYFRNDYVGAEELSRRSEYVFPVLFRGHKSFAKMWFANIQRQRYLEVLKNGAGNRNAA